MRVDAGAGFQVERVSLGVDRPDAGKGTVQMLYNALHGALEEVAQTVAVGETEGHICSQRRLPRLTSAQELRLTPVGDIANHDHRAQQIVTFMDLRAGVLDWERFPVPGLELIRLANLHGA